MAQEWIELGKALATGIGLAIPLVGTMAYFHGERGRRFDALDATTKRLDSDFNALLRQMAAQTIEAEKHFLPRQEHDSDIRRLSADIVKLDRTITDNIGKLNDHLFNLARGQRDDPDRRR